MNFQMFKLDLEKAEEPEIKLQHPLDHQQSKIVPEKNIYFCLIDYAKAFDCVDQSRPEICKEKGIPDHLIFLRNMYACQKATVRTGHEQLTASKLGKD